MSVICTKLFSGKWSDRKTVDTQIKHKSSWDYMANVQHSDEQTTFSKFIFFQDDVPVLFEVSPIFMCYNMILNKFVFFSDNA